MSYGEKIKAIREKLFLSQEELAKLLGFSITTVNRWETGKFEPSIKAKKALKIFCDKNNIEFYDFYNKDTFLNTK